MGQTFINSIIFRDKTISYINTVNVFKFSQKDKKILKKLKNSLANKGNKPWNIRETQGIAYVNDNKKFIIYQSIVTSHNKIKNLHHKNLTILDEALLKEKQKNFIENKQKINYKEILKSKSRYFEPIYYKEPIKKKSIRVKKNGITMENNTAKRFEQEILLYKKTLNSYNKIK